MGAVLCERHGYRVGILACSHLRTAAWKREPLPPHGEVVLAVDDDIAISQLICDHCQRQYDLKVGATVDGETWESNDFPDVAPACPDCLRELNVEPGN